MIRPCEPGSDAQIGEQVDELKNQVRGDRGIRLSSRHGFLQPFPGRFDQSWLMLVLDGPYQLRSTLGQVFLVGRWLGLVQLRGQVLQEVGYLPPGFRLQMLRLADAACE